MGKMRGGICRSVSLAYRELRSCALMVICECCRTSGLVLVFRLQVDAYEEILLLAWLSARTAKSQMRTGCNQILLLADVCMSCQLFGCPAKILIGSSGGGRLAAVDHCGREAGACRGARWLSSCVSCFAGWCGRLRVRVSEENPVVMMVACIHWPFSLHAGGPAHPTPATCNQR